jgi:hypothetical protein
MQLVMNKTNIQKSILLPETMIHPFILNAPQQILEDLKLRIKNTRWPDEVNDSGWSYGASLSYIKGKPSHILSWKFMEKFSKNENKLYYYSA